MRLKWGQSQEKLFVSFELVDNENFTYNVDGQKVTILSNGVDLSFELSKQVTDFTKTFESQRLIKLEFTKEEPSEWDKLCNDKLKRQWVTIDWNHWINNESDDDTSGQIPNMMNPNMMNYSDDDYSDPDGEEDEESDEEHQEEHQEEYIDKCDYNDSLQSASGQNVNNDDDNNLLN